MYRIVQLADGRPGYEPLLAAECVACEDAKYRKKKPLVGGVDIDKVHRRRPR